MGLPAEVRIHADDSGTDQQYGQFGILDVEHRIPDGPETRFESLADSPYYPWKNKSLQLTLGAEYYSFRSPIM
jgi:hypothetical protein